MTKVEIEHRKPPPSKKSLRYGVKDLITKGPSQDLDKRNCRDDLVQNFTSAFAQQSANEESPSPINSATSGYDRQKAN